MKKKTNMLSRSHAAFGFLAAAALASTAFAQTPYTVVMTGLDNPRGLDLAPNGALYVAEAGRGGAGPCIVLPRETRCYGNTGAISRLWKGEQSRVVSGLPSHATPGGTDAGGPSGISFHGTGGAYITLGLGGGPGFREALGNAHFGTLNQMAASGQWKTLNDLLVYEALENPAGGQVDSNPFAVLAEAGARFVVDAGANALLSVAPDGVIKTVAVFSSQPNPLPFGPPVVESVPTSVARGPDGHLYVGELTGAPFAPGLARIHRVVEGGAPVPYCTQFTAIIDLAFEADGSLLVVEHATGGPFFPTNSGRLSRVAPDCSRTTLLGGLDRPTSVAVGRDGAIYVTNHGVTPGAGQVLKLAP